VNNFTLQKFALWAATGVLTVFHARAAETGRMSPLLHHALELADLNNWTDAEPEFARAAVVFRKNGDAEGLAYAELGVIRSTIQRRNLALTSTQLQDRLNSDPLMMANHDLRLFCLAIKGDIDAEMAATAMREDWEQVTQLAAGSADPRWRYRASAGLGMVAFYEGDHATARKNIAGALLAAAQAHDVGDQVKYLYAIGIGLNESRMNSEAIPYLDKAISLSEATTGAPFPFMPYLAKAEALATTGHVAEAKRMVEWTVDSARKRTAPIYEANALGTLAEINLASNNMNEAIANLFRAIQIGEKGSYTRLATELRISLADIYRSRGDLSNAEALLVSATRAAQKSGELYTLPERLRILAEIQEREGRFVEADRTYDRAAAFIDASIGNDSAVLDKTAWIKSVSELYVGHFDLIAKHLNNPAKAYAVVEQVRGRVMSDLLLGGSTAPVKARDDEEAMSHLRLRMMAAGSTANIEKIRDQLFLLEQARWVTPDVNILKSRSYTHVPLRDVQETLNPNATILEYILADPNSWCLVIRRDGIRIVQLKGRQQIESLVSSYLKAVADKRVDEAGGRDLYSALIQPVREAAQTSYFMIVRDGFLNRLSFDSLREPSGGYLGARTVISYLPSAGSFYLLAKESNESGQEKKVLAIGGVPYEQQSSYFKNVIASQGFGETELANLQNSREEAVTAAAGAAERDSDVLLGSSATESAVKKAVSERYRVIHLAVHSVVDVTRPDRAALILLADPGAGEDGLLQAPEIAQMRLKTNLVVLSACDTAVGPIEGQEGVATLARSFLIAGAQNVISTLWATDDNSSLALLKQFYSHLAAGESAAASLADAKRDFLTKFGPKAAPYYWAAFTFEGVPKTATIFHDKRQNDHDGAQSEGSEGNHQGN